jgi:hypothetical protein
MPVSVEVKNATSQLDGVGIYSGGTYRLIPAPLVSISKNYEKTNSDVNIGATLTLQLTGTLLATMGNAVPTSYSGGTVEARFINTDFAATVDVNDDATESVSDAVHNDRLGIILAKQEALRTLFTGNIINAGDNNFQSALGNPYSRGPVKLLLEPLNGGAAFEFLCNVENVSFEQGIWYDKCAYTIDLTCSNWSNNLSEISAGFGTEDQWKYHIKDLQESWDIQEAENTFYFGVLKADGQTDSNEDGFMQKVWDITHTVSAVGKRTFADASNNFTVVEAYQNASGIIYDSDYGLLASNKLTSLGGNEYTLPSGFDMGLIGSVVGTTSLVDGDRDNEYALGLKSFVEQRDITAGSVNVTESFIFAPRNTLVVGATETMSLTEEDNKNTGLKTYSLQGSVKGINTKDYKSNVGNAWVNASGYYAGYVEPFLLSRVSLLSDNAATGVFVDSSNINPTFLTKSVGKNPNTNEINYSVSYDTRRQNMTSALLESVSVQEGLQGNNYAEIPIIGRRSGPIIQYLNSDTSRTRSLSINLTVARPSNSGATIADKARHVLLTSNPSNANSVYSSEITGIIDGVNPDNTGEAPNGAVNDPPTENWNPDTGVYSYSILWKWESPVIV